MSAQLYRKYETVVVARHDAGHEAHRKLHQRITEMMEKEGVRPIRFEYWGKRKLAYPINKATKGVYLYHMYLANSEFVAKLTRMLQLSPIVLRYLTIRLSDWLDPEKYDATREEHFDTLPSEPEEREHVPTTGWTPEVIEQTLGLEAGTEEEEYEDEEMDEDEEEDSDEEEEESEEEEEE